MNVKEKIKHNKLTQWQVAEVLEINEFSFSRMLRHVDQLDKDLIDKIEKAIDELTNR